MLENNNTNIESVADGADSTKKGRAKDNRPPTPAATVKTKAAEKQAYMYLGPNIPGGRLFSGNLFKCKTCDDIKHLGDLYEKLPAIKRLFVEVKNVPEFKRQLLEQGTQASGFYQQARMEISDAIKEGVFKNGI